MLMVFYYGGKMVGQETITVGELSSFLVYAAFVGISIGGLAYEDFQPFKLWTNFNIL